jgi:hypothetical protein
MEAVSALGNNLIIVGLNSVKADGALAVHCRRRCSCLKLDIINTLCSSLKAEKVFQFFLF